MDSFVVVVELAEDLVPLALADGGIAGLPGLGWPASSWFRTQGCCLIRAFLRG